MHNLLLWLTHLLLQYGYPALFLLLVLGIAGLPVPDETLLTFCGYLIYSGRLLFALTFAAGFCGSTMGVTISYGLGARFGQTVFDRFGKYVFLTPARLQRTEKLFQRYGAPLVTVGYFIPGVRHFTAIVAGMSGLPFRKFALFAYSGAALWVATFLTLGYVMGDGWQNSSELVHRYVLAGIAALLLIGALVWLVQARSASFSKK
jgi:membrane protein DedA with SNARE-associated domain